MPTFKTHFTLVSNTRLVHQDVIGRITAYPLSHVTGAAREAVNVAQKKFEIKGVYTSWTSYDAALMVAFDNNGMDYFIPQDIDGWAQAITQAIPSAPALDYSQTPPLRPSLKSEPQSANPAGTVKQKSSKLFLILAAVVFLCICAVSACVLIPFLSGLLGSGGSSG